MFYLYTRSYFLYTIYVVFCFTFISGFTSYTQFTSPFYVLTLWQVLFLIHNLPRYFLFYLYKRFYFLYTIHLAIFCFTSIRGFSSYTQFTSLYLFYLYKIFYFLYTIYLAIVVLPLYEVLLLIHNLPRSFLFYLYKRFYFLYTMYLHILCFTSIIGYSSYTQLTSLFFVLPL